MPFSDFLKSHLAAYPDMEPQDVLDETMAYYNDQIRQ